MSGIYIPGIEMQENCFECPLNKDDGFGYFTCGVTKNECDWLKLPDDCPLIPVPEHGPLVDALDVINTFPEEFIFTNEQARALTNYIIPADPAKEGEGC